MRSIVTIPIKHSSERVPGKNLRRLGKKPLYQHIVSACIEADCFDKIVVDTDSPDILEFYRSSESVYTVERPLELTKDGVNGNDLMVRSRELFPGFSHYFQAFATAPFLKPETIRRCVRDICHTDSVFTAQDVHDFIWVGDVPLIRPGVLPRSQDVNYLTKETTGLYGITFDALDKYKCRIGAYPEPVLVSDIEAIDINTEMDFKFAEFICQTT